MFRRRGYRIADKSMRRSIVLESATIEPAECVYGILALPTHVTRRKQA
jgi:hypothetical protein